MFQFLQQLNFGHRLVLYRLLIALFVSGLIYSAFYISGPGERALKRARVAVSHARSWKVQYVKVLPEGPRTLDTLIEMTCPTSTRTTMNFSTDEKGRHDSWTNIALTTNGSAFFFDSRQNYWIRDDAEGRNPSGNCALMARGEDTDMLPPLGRWAQFGSLKKGGLRDTGLGQCQEWQVSFPPGPNSPKEKMTVCLGLDDNLPRFMTEGDVTYRYFDWNVPIEFNPPAEARKAEPLQ